MSQLPWVSCFGRIAQCSPEPVLALICPAQRLHSGSCNLLGVFLVTHQGQSSSSSSASLKSSDGRGN